MALNFQYNKTAQQLLEKQLKVRERALPTLKNKESALRVEVKKAKEKSLELEGLIAAALEKHEAMAKLWCEFDATLLGVKDVTLSTKKIAGVKTPVLEEVVFEVAPINLVAMPVWVPQGVAILRELAQLGIEREVFDQKTALLDFARKKTTQKVNLYEKVQIPGYHDAILKIKRFLEDEENLSKSAQKIVKNRQMQMEGSL
jgi:V/A-type H+/Na+-transporting ATPase subunit D